MSNDKQLIFRDGLGEYTWVLDYAVTMPPRFSLAEPGKTMSNDKKLIFRAALNLLDADLLIGMVEELKFYRQRRWRFDFAWPDAQVAVEIDGGRWAPGGGRHASDSDREKLSAAAALGWRVLRFSTQQVEQDPTGCVDITACAVRRLPLPAWMNKSPGRRKR
jgi:very-short-patch-repair endonuclease